MNFGDARLPERFWSRVHPCPMTGCWLWMACIEGGYGRTRLIRTTNTRLAHRIAFVAANGNVNEEMVLDHLCRVRSCVNPAHLEEVTSHVNTLRGSNANALHCDRGHEFSVENTRWMKNRRCPSGYQRVCIACRRAAGRARGKAIRENRVGAVS